MVAREALDMLAARGRHDLLLGQHEDISALISAWTNDKTP
jgi:hypothetical protein